MHIDQLEECQKDRQNVKRNYDLKNAEQVDGQKPHDWALNDS